MTRKISVNLTKKGLRHVRAQIRNMQKDLREASRTINMEVATECADKMLARHDEFIDTLEPDPYSHSVITKVDNLRNKSIAKISGPSVIYDEFGTGDVGDRNFHPEHDKFGMNEYSSGDYVSTHIDENGHYWDFDDFKKIRGVPAGMFFYDTVNEMKLDGEAKKIAKKVVTETIDKSTGGDK